MIFQRHSLCYLKADAHPLIAKSGGDDALLTFWQEQQFPLIFTHQPSHLGTNQIKLAIPYFEPETQKKIRTSYLFSPTAINYSTSLPYLKELLPNLTLQSKSILRVYGSYCWQYITQHPYVQPSSDLDVQITYVKESLNELAQLYNTLSKIMPMNSLDGEVRFATIGDCSWRELIEKTSSEHILFKSTHQIQLISREQLYAAIPTLLA